MHHQQPTRISSAARFVPVALNRPSSAAATPPFSTACVRRSHDCCSLSDALSSLSLSWDSSLARLRPFQPASPPPP